MEFYRFIPVPRKAKIFNTRGAFAVSTSIMRAWQIFIDIIAQLWYD